MAYSETALSSIQVFKDILKLKEQLEREVLPHFSTRRQANAQTVMRHLYKSPIVNISGLVALLGLQTNTASALVSDFVKYGVLQEFTGRQRNRLFWFKDYLWIFKQQGE